MDPLTSSIITIVANLGFGGVLALIHWWTVRVEIPRRDTEARAERDAALAAFRDEIKNERDANNAHVEKIVGRLEKVESAVIQLAQHGDRRRPFDQNQEYPR